MCMMAKNSDLIVELYARLTAVREWARAPQETSQLDFLLSKDV